MQLVARAHFPDWVYALPAIGHRLFMARLRFVRSAEMRRLVFRLRPFPRLTIASLTATRRGATPPAPLERIAARVGVAGSNGTGRSCYSCGVITFGWSDRCGRCGSPTGLRVIESHERDGAAWS